MKIIDSGVDYNTPGIYWDGATVYLVDASCSSYPLGTLRANYEFLETGADSADTTTPAERVALIDATARLMEASK